MNKNHFNSEGYLEISKLLPRTLITQLKDHIHRLIEHQPNWAKQSWQFLDPSQYHNQLGEPLPYTLQRPSLHDDLFETFAHHPTIINRMNELLQGEVELFTDQVGVKYGDINNNQAGCSYYHQDSYYWKLPPNSGVNVWIPLDKVDINKIALAIIPKSHHNQSIEDHEHYYDNPEVGNMLEGTWTPFKRHRIPHAKIDLKKEKVFPMSAGDALFFTNYTWHRSEPNRCGKTKLFYAIAYRKKVSLLESV